MIFENYDRIVFIGDSVTDMGSEGCHCDRVGEGLGRGYVRVIDSMLAAWYPRLHIRVTNSGINGATSRDIRSRFDELAMNLHPAWVSICIGINDVWRQFDCPSMPDRHILPQEYAENVEYMILRAKDSCKGVFLCTPFYIEPSREDAMRARMDEYSAICQQLSEKLGCIFVDFQTMYEKHCQFCHSTSIAWDRVHPNQIGATLMAREFLKHCDFDYSHR